MSQQQRAGHALFNIDHMLELLAYLNAKHDDELRQKRQQRQRRANYVPLSKARTIELLDSLNVNHDGINKFVDLKQLLYRELPDYTGKKSYTAISRYIEDEVLMHQHVQEIVDDLDIFNNYQPPQPLSQLSQEALVHKDHILKQLKDYQPFDVDFTNATQQTQTAYLMGLIESLKSLNVQNGNKYLVLRLKYGDGKESMHIVNAQTIDRLLHIIAVLEGRASDDTEDYASSDQAILFGQMTLTGYGLEWYNYKKIDKAFGYFPYYNKLNDLDLSTFGIYHNDDEANYTDNCFVLAAINSKLFTPDEIDLMRSMINTRYIPRDDIKYVAETLGVQIDTHYFNERTNKIDKAVRFNVGCERVLRILIRCGHGMIYRDELVPPNKYDVHNLNTLITKMLANHELEYINDVSTAEKFMSFTFDYDTLEYPPCSVKPFIERNSNGYRMKNKSTTFDKVYPAIYKDGVFHLKTHDITYDKLFDWFNGNTLLYLPSLHDLKETFANGKFHVKISMYRNTVQQIRLFTPSKYVTLRSFQSLTSIDAHEMDIDAFFDLVTYVKLTMQRTLNIDINRYSALPKMSLAIAFKHNCFNGVYAMSGLPKSFASKCVKGGIVKTLHDGCFEVNNVTCLDINSSYGSSMAVMRGIPKGKPKPFYHAIPDDADYAFIQVNVTNIKCDKLGRYGFIHDGINYIDSVLYDELMKYVECDIEVINGYYFNEGFNDEINKLARILYDLRSDATLNRMGKNLLSSLYGKSLQNAQQFTIRFVPREKLIEFIADNGNFIYDMTKNKKTGVYTVRLLKSLNLNYNVPQLGVQILSESRKRMNDIINYCRDNDISIYAIRTDSVVVPSERVQIFEKRYKIGHELGMFKIEYEAEHVKYTSNATYKAVLVDGNVRMRGKVN